MNTEERKALKHTFGEETGTYFADKIDVQFDPDVGGGQFDPDKPTVITLNPSYEHPKHGASGKNIAYLSTFVHEAVHMWQHETRLHQGGKGGVD